MMALPGDYDAAVFEQVLDYQGIAFSVFRHRANINIDQSVANVCLERRKQAFGELEPYFGKALAEWIAALS